MLLIFLAITEIILDLHQRIDSIKAIVSSLVLSDPAKLVYAIHQIIKEVGISKFLFIATHITVCKLRMLQDNSFLLLVCIRFVVLCETYLKRKDELSKGERKEILEYARGRYICAVCISLCMYTYLCILHSSFFIILNSAISFSALQILWELSIIKTLK